MKAFLATVLLLVASASANQPMQAKQDTVPHSQATDRDTGYTSTSGFSSDFQSAGNYQKPLAYNSGTSYYNNDPGFNVQAGFGTNGLNAGSLFPADLIQTGLSIVLGIFAFSLLVQILTKVASSNLFDDLLGKGRSMSPDDLAHYTNMVMDAYHKFEEMNTPK